jgi:multidrug efflux pump subunit AcrA (membrane-fusion protein)
MRLKSLVYFATIPITALLLAGCEKESANEAIIARPVRTTTVEASRAATPLTFTGRIESADEAALGFRIGGRMVERKVGVGDRVDGGQLIARLDPQNETNALRSQQANLAAANAKLTEAPQQI